MTLTKIPRATSDETPTSVLDFASVRPFEFDSRAWLRELGSPVEHRISYEENRAMMSLKERYQNDAIFKRVVDVLETLISKHQMTPTEIREAAILACVHSELRIKRPTEFPPEVQEAFETIRKFRDAE
jgi:hypothetical protein